MKIAITGANGYLASLIKKLNNSKFEFVSVYRKDVDLANTAKVREYFEDLDFDIILHTAAQAATAFCENNEELSTKINVEATKAIADVCKRRHKRMIFFSTEQCFNGKKTSGPFNEDASLEAKTNYGKQKIEADEYIRNNLNDYVILRLSWMMGLDEINVKASPNILRNVLNAIINDQATTFTVNEKRGLTYAKHLATNFARIINLETGVYHFSTTNNLNTYESACYIARRLGISENRINKLIIPNFDKYKDAYRDIRLDNTKINTKGIKLGTFEDDVDEALKDYGYLR